MYHTMTAETAKLLVKESPHKILYETLRDIDIAIEKAARGGASSQVLAWVPDHVKLRVADVLRQKGFKVSLGRTYVKIAWEEKT